MCGGVCAWLCVGGGSCWACRTASERLVSQRESSSGHAPANRGGENRAAGSGQPNLRGLAGAGMACGVWRVRPSRQDRRWLEMNSSEASKTRTKWCSSFPYRAPARTPPPMRVRRVQGGVRERRSARWCAGCVAAQSLVSGWYSVGTCASFQKGALGIQISCFPFIRGHERRGAGRVRCGRVRCGAGRCMQLARSC